MKSMRKKIMELQLAIDEKDKLFTIVDLILAKHDKGTNERLLIKGMLALIEPIPELKVECEELAILLDLNRLNKMEGVTKNEETALSYNSGSTNQFISCM